MTFNVYIIFVTGLSVSCELLKRGVEAVTTEGGFCSTILQTAEELSKWMACPSNEIVTAAFSKKVVTSLEECIANHPMNRSGRTKICGAFHQLWSSEAFKSEWVNFLQKVTSTDPDPTFYQYVIGKIFDEILKQHCPIVQPTSAGTSPEELSLSYEEQNALRYQLQAIYHERLQKSSVLHHTHSKISSLSV